MWSFKVFRLICSSLVVSVLYVVKQKNVKTTSVRPSVCDVTSATKPSVSFSSNSIQEHFTKVVSQVSVSWKSAPRRQQCRSLGHGWIYSRASDTCWPTQAKLVTDDVNIMRPGGCEFSGKRSNEIHTLLRAKSENFSPMSNIFFFRFGLNSVQTVHKQSISGL